MPGRIGFILSSPSSRPLPSTRIGVLNMLPFLRAANFDAQIVYEPPRESTTPDVSSLAARLIAERFDVVCLQKVTGASVLKLARQLRAAGIKTVSFVCDGIDSAMTEVTDATIAATDYLRRSHPRELQQKVHVVHDGIEHPEYFKSDWGDHTGSLVRPLRAVLVTSAKLGRLPVIGSPPSWLEVVIVGQYAPAGNVRERVRELWWAANDDARLRGKLSTLRFALHDRIRLAAWHQETVYRTMLGADIGIIPVEPRDATGENAAWHLKSENRLTLKMALALPVVATPIPSYQRVIKQGWNGFLAGPRSTWIQYLDALRDPALRRDVALRARASVLERFSLEAQARRLIAVLDRLVEPREAANEPFIDVPVRRISAMAGWAHLSSAAQHASAYR